MHPYHLPSEVEFAEKQVLIASQCERIQSIEVDIEKERQNLDAAVSALNEKYHPSIDEIKARIAALIKQERLALAELDRKRLLAELDLKSASEAKVALLETERAQLDKELKDEKGFVAPIRRLPSDVLREIFEWVQVVNSPWILAKVCKSWRGIALRTPQLWARIHITHDRTRYRTFHASNSSKLPPASSFSVTHGNLHSTLWGRITYETESSVERKNPDQLVHTLEGLKKALELCGRVPLTLIVDLPRFHHDFMYAPSSVKTSRITKQKCEMLEFLLPYLSRCRSITIKGILPFSELGDDITTRLENADFTSLEELEIHTTLDDTARLFLRNAQQTASRLLKIALLNHSDSNHPTLPLQVSQLKHLTSLTITDSGGSPMEVDAAAIASLSELKDLEITGQDLTSWAIASLPSLERLAITRGFITDLGGIVRKLRFLYLEDVLAPPPNAVISVPALETLIIFGERMEVAKAIEAPTLENLHLYHTGQRQKTISNTTISSIWNPKGARGDKLLNPRHLHLVVEASETVVVKALRSMDRIEDLVLGLREHRDAGRKLLDELTVVPQVTKTKGGKENRLGLCPQLKSFEIFTVDSDGGVSSWDSPEEVRQLENLLKEMENARPKVTCKLTQWRSRTDPTSLFDRDLEAQIFDGCSRSDSFPLESADEMDDFLLLAANSFL